MTREDFDAKARVGRTLRGKWRLDTLIEVGGMAAVYAATHRNGMRGAVKVLHAICASDAELVGRFRREGYIANMVGHSGAVRVLDDDVDDDGSPFLVMELLEGMPLHERMGSQGGAVSPREAMLMADQLLDLLVAAHDRGIVHRDIKPENLFVTTDGQLKLLDFGIARLGEEDGEDAKNAVARGPAEPVQHGRARTIAGIAMGTPAYMSPEQARGRWDLVGPQSDLWSVGATLFSALSGECVHEKETPGETLAAAMRTPARSLSSIMPHAHPELVAVVDRALYPKLADRWPDARAMRAALRAAYVTIEGEPPPALLRRHRPWADPPVSAGRSSEDAATMTATRSLVRAPAGSRVAWLASGLLVVGLASSIGLRTPSRHGAARQAMRSFVHAGTRELLAQTLSSDATAPDASSSLSIDRPAADTPRPSPTRDPTGATGGISSARGREPEGPPSLRSSVFDHRY